MLPTIYAPAQIRFPQQTLDVIQETRLLAEHEVADPEPIYSILPGEEAEFEAAFSTLLQHAELVDRNLHKICLLIEDHLLRPLIDIIESTKLEKAIMDGRVASSSGKPRHIFSIPIMQDYTEILTNAEILAESIISWMHSSEGAAHRRVMNSAYKDMRTSLSKWLEDCPLVCTNQGKAPLLNNTSAQGPLSGQHPIPIPPTRGAQGLKNTCVSVHVPGHLSHGLTPPPLSPLLRPIFSRSTSPSQRRGSPFRRGPSSSPSPPPNLPLRPSTALALPSPPVSDGSPEGPAIIDLDPPRSPSPMSLITQAPSPPITPPPRKRSLNESQDDYACNCGCREPAGSSEPSRKRVRFQDGPTQCPWAPSRVKIQPPHLTRSRQCCSCCNGDISLLPESPSPLRIMRTLDDLVLTGRERPDTDPTEGVPHLDLEMESLSAHSDEMDEDASVISLLHIEEPPTPHSAWSFTGRGSGSLWSELPRLPKWVKAIKDMFPVFRRRQ